MIIKQLDIAGFKSFPDRTTLQFERGIACVIGPNGCGKSNIVDAVKWCLGEQSARSLRGSSMEDVIFNGSEQRGASSKAQVSILFDRGDGVFPGIYEQQQQLQITRTLKRTGSSQYAINNVRVRLRDIHELFLDTGVHNQRYSFIEQGQIGTIVSARPATTRLLFEEAAGISRFKIRREGAEEKLRQMSVNLDQASLLVERLRERVKELEGQVQAAMRYRRFSSRLKQLGIAIGLSKYVGYLESRERVTTELNSKKSAFETLDIRFRREQSLLAKGREAQQVTARSVQAELNKQAEDKAELSSGETSLRYQRTESTELQARQAQYAERQARESERKERIAASIAREQEGISELSAKLDIITEEASALRVDQQSAIATLSQIDSEIMDKRAFIDASIKQQAELQSGIQITLERHQDNRRELARLEPEREHNRSALATQSLEEEALLQRQQELTESLTALAAQRQALDELQRLRQSEHRQHINGENSLRQQVTNAERQLVKFRARRDAVVQMLDSTDSISPDLQSAAEHSGYIGTVAHHLDVPPEWQSTVLVVLGETLDALVAKDQAAAVEMTTLCKSRAQVVSLEQLELAPAQQQDSMIEHLGGTDVGQRLIGFFLGGISVKELADNSELLDQRPVRPTVFTVQNKKAAYYWNGDTWVTGAPGSNAQHVLLMRQQLQELNLSVAAALTSFQELSSHLVEAQQKRETSAESLAQLAKSLEVVVAEQGSLRLALREIQLSHQRCLSERERLERLIASSEQRAVGLDQQASILQAKQRELREQSEHLTQQCEQIEQSLRLLQSSRASEFQSRRTIDDRLSHLDRAQIKLQTSIQAGERQLQQLTRSHQEAENQLSELLAQQQKDQRRIAFLVVDNERISQEISQMQHQIAARQATILTLNQESDTRNQDLMVLEERALSTQHEHQQLTVVIAQLEARIDGLRKAIYACKAQLLEDHEIHASAELSVLERNHQLLLDVDQDALELPTPEPEEHLVRPLLLTLSSLVDSGITAQWNRDLKQLSEARTQIGEVNFIAIPELRDARAELLRIEEQWEDLQLSSEQIQQSIDELNQLCRQRFDDTFKAVDEQFSLLYPQLVGGGQAKLSLDDPEDLLTAGVIIFAQPPGKRLQSLTLLSGGEKAMVAVALLFALFKVKPSPFCLLDEVDAPLDEANGTRFNRMLREMAAESQFIVITHNKTTMEAGDVLYGVSMPHSGVSKLVSVRLDDIDARQL